MINKSFTMTLSEELKERVQRICRIRGETMAAMIRRLLNEEIERMEKVSQGER